MSMYGSNNAFSAKPYFSQCLDNLHYRVLYNYEKIWNGEKRNNILSQITVNNTNRVNTPVNTT